MIKVVPLNDNILKIVINEKESLSFVKEIKKETNLWDYNIKENEIKIIWNKEYKINFKVFIKDHIEIFHDVEENDRIYGLGEKYARLNRRYKRFHMWNVDQQIHLPSGDPTYLSIPFYILANPKKFLGILIDYAGYIYIDTGVRNLNEVFIKIKSDYARIYLIAGKNLKEILRCYSEMTGKPFLPPKWALGYHQSRYSYMNQDEVLEIASEFRKRKIPCDAIYLDIHHMNEFKNFTWDSKRFPNPKEMIEKLKDLKIKLVTIVNAGIKASKGYAVYDKLKEIDGFIKYSNNETFLGIVWPGICAFPDFLNEKVRKLWSYFISEWLNQGIDGIWLDMNEPSIFLILNKDMEKEFEKVLNNELSLFSFVSKFSTNLINKNIGYVKIDTFHNLNGSKIHHDEVHNAYPLFQIISTYEGFIKSNSNKRSFILSRSGFIGIQRYAAVWTGDNQADWSHMEISAPQLLSLGLSGNSFVGADIGGFSDDADPELLIRWFQLGAFYPLFRNHSDINSRRKEPWVFGEEVESMIKEAINLRYKLLPYLYKLFVDSYREGLPIIRPLCLEFPFDENCYDIDDEFMLGDSLLVAPILNPGSKARAVCLPENKWLNLWNGKIYKKGWNFVEADLKTIPVFLKENSAIITTNVKESAEEPWDKITIETFLTKNVNVKIYDDDDGITFNYKKGEFFEIELNIKKEKNKLKINTNILNDKFEPSFNKIEVKILNKINIERAFLNNKEYDFSKHEGFIFLEFDLKELMGK